MICYGYNIFLFCVTSYCFVIAVASSGFSIFSDFSFNSSVSILSLMVMELISSFLISSSLSRLAFFLSESFCSYTKNNHYTTNLKHRLQTKNAMCNIVLKRVFYMIKGCKRTPSPPFLQNYF